MISRTKRLFLISLSILAFLIISLVPIHAQGGGGGGGGGGTRNDTNYTAYFDPEIEEEFDVKDHVVIIVNLHTLNISKADEILANLSAEEFTLRFKFVDGSGFSGNATEGAFEKLVHNPDINAIHLSRTSYIQEINITTTIINNTQYRKGGGSLDGSRIMPIVFIILVTLVVAIAIFFKKKRRDNG